VSGTVPQHTCATRTLPTNWWFYNVATGSKCDIGLLFNCAIKSYKNIRTKVNVNECILTAHQHTEDHLVPAKFSRRDGYDIYRYIYRYEEKI